MIYNNHPNMKPKLAFCFRGICKNFDPLWNNYKEKIIDPLSSIYNIDFYLSTNKISKYISSRSNENHETKWDSILPYFNFTQSLILEEQDPIFSKILDFSNNLVNEYGGNWGETPEGWSDQQSKQTTFFAIKNLYSIYLLKTIVPKTYDKYLITRQDMVFLDTIDPNLVYNSTKDALIPSHSSWGGYCDRFAILNTKAFDIYTNRYKTITEYKQKYHEENYLKFNCLDKYNITVQHIHDFKFDVMRLNNKN